jgi:aspartyl-tRNA(Asn)/glutamyl-tRNA(Gln) amidotransferase subunit A
MTIPIEPFLTIAQAGKLIAAGKLSPLELTRDLITRIEFANPKLNAYLTVAEPQALAAARAAERALRAGKKGRLLGIPLAYKDVFDTAGIRTTANSRVLAENIPNADAEPVRRLAEAGAIVLGKLAAHEFAMGGPAFDLPWPPARNPWDLRRFTGGSSSGSAAAVAAGLCLGSLGTDTTGSIRVPAAYCGIAGLKPTAGLVSRRGVIALAPTLDTIGPMAWTAEDCAILLDAIAGPDAADPASRAGPKLSYARAIAVPVKGLRVGLVRRFYERDAPAERDVQQMMTRVTSGLEDAGCRVEEVVLPSVHDYNAVARVIVTAEAYALHEASLRSRLSEYSRVFRMRVLPGALIRAADYIAAQRQRADLATTTAAALKSCDLLITAATQGGAPMLGEQRPDDGYSQPALAVPANIAALPSLVVCGGRTLAGLPLGVQIIGPAWGEGLVLRLGHHIEMAAGTRALRPTL